MSDDSDGRWMMRWAKTQKRRSFYGEVQGEREVAKSSIEIDGGQEFACERKITGGDLQHSPNSLRVDSDGRWAKRWPDTRNKRQSCYGEVEGEGEVANSSIGIDGGKQFARKRNIKGSDVLHSRKGQTDGSDGMWERRWADTNQGNPDIRT